MLRYAPSVQVKMLLYLLEYFSIAMAPLWVLAELLVILYFGPGYWKANLGLVRSWDVTIFTFFVFSIMGPAGTVAFIYRARLPSRKVLVVEMWDQVKYAFLTSIQWTSYSYRFGDVIARYMLGFKITSWGATGKEVEDDVFTDNEFRDVIVPLYSTQILWSLLVYCLWASYTWLQSIPVPEGFGVYSLTFAYFMAPFILNPNLIRLRY